MKIPADYAANEGGPKRLKPTCRQIEGVPTGKGLKALIVVSRFNEIITNRLAFAAEEVLLEQGVKKADLTIVWVPGALEIAPALRRLGKAGVYDAIVALGCVIRGDTPHFDVVVNESARAIGSAVVELAELGVGVGFGVLTTDNVEQAIERAGTKGSPEPMNKGGDAASVALEMTQLYRTLFGQRRRSRSSLGKASRQASKRTAKRA